MPFVPSDLLAMAGILSLIFVLKNANNKRSILLCIISGILFGLSTLAWSGAILIYLPLALFAFLVLFFSMLESTKQAPKLLLSFIVPFLLILVLERLL